VAGLVYAFAPLRVPQFAHLQVVSSQWMPFVFFGLRRYFDTRRVKALAWAGVALVAQNLSCGYFLLFFAPLVVAYVLFEIASRKAWRDLRMWVSLGVTGAGVFAATLPFLLPYLELRRLGFPPRPLSEVASYAADVYSYWTSPAESRLWGGTIRAYPKAEGDLFPTVTAIGLALIGWIAGARSAWKQALCPVASHPALRPVVYLLFAAGTVYAIFVSLILMGQGFAQIGALPISVRSLGRAARMFLIVLVALLAVSPRVRSFARGWLGSVIGFLFLATLFCFLMSLGPEIRSLGRTLRASAPYAFFYDHVPGFDGLRVPARYGMLVMMFLAMTAGFGAAAIERRLRRGTALLAFLGVFAVAESIAAPIVINGTQPEAGYATPPPRVFVGAQAPQVYRFLEDLPAPGTVVAEFPFGQWGYELRYVYYSTFHWHPLINGYSGTFPLSYHARALVLRDPGEYAEAAWTALRESGATHAVVHEDFYRDGRGQAVSQWLTGHGGRLVAQFGGDKVFEVTRDR
jgi:hypothetical protein